MAKLSKFHFRTGESVSPGVPIAMCGEELHDHRRMSWHGFHNAEPSLYVMVGTQQLTDHRFVINDPTHLAKCCPDYVAKVNKAEMVQPNDNNEY